MPDIVSPTPAPGAPIESAWGSEIHLAIEGIQCGQIDGTLPSGSNGVDLSVTFPKPYATAPVFVAVTGPIGSSVFVGNVASVSAASAAFKVFRKDETNQGSNVTVRCQWIAIGKLA